MQMLLQPMPLLKRPLPFDDPNWIFELKYDGFRALAVIENGRARLLSRNGHPFASFAELGKLIAAGLPHVNDIVLDGEIVCVDGFGKPQFVDLLFHRGYPCDADFALPADIEVLERNCEQMGGAMNITECFSAGPEYPILSR